MRILIVKVSSLGDIIHTLPAVTDAKRAHRNLVIDWVVEEGFVEIPSWHPAVDNVIPVAIRRWRKNIIKTYMNSEYREFKRQLQNIHYDLVIDAQGLIKSGIISRLSKGLTIGLSNKTIREPLATLFYNKVYSVPWSEHAVDRVRHLFSRALQYSYDQTELDYGLDLSRVALPKVQVNQSLKTGVTKKRQVVFLHGTTWKTKFWPLNYWRELAAIAQQQGYEIILPWGDEEEKVTAEKIADGHTNAIVLDKQSLSGLAGHILESAGAIAVDTGLGHLAAALSVPTVSLYGPTDPGLSGTYGHRQLHLKSEFSCAPCIKKNCGYTGESVSADFNNEKFLVTPPCFSTHTPQQVWQQFEQLLLSQ